MKYYVEVFDYGSGYGDCFLSSSRNARKHLRDRLPPSSSGKCVVFSANGDRVISACAYDENGVIRYISW